MKNPRNAGRKPKYGVPTRKTTINVPHPLDTRIDDEATRRGVTRSEVVIQALNETLPGEPKLAGVDAFN